MAVDMQAAPQHPEMMAAPQANAAYAIWKTMACKWRSAFNFITVNRLDEESWKLSALKSSIAAHCLANLLRITLHLISA